MARLNRTPVAAVVTTHEGGRAVDRLSPMMQLRRSVMSCLLWEREFCEDGETITARIAALVSQCPLSAVAVLAAEVRLEMHLRHVPLYLMALVAHDKRAKNSSLVSAMLPDVIRRADELAEFLAIYAEVNGVKPNAVKKVMSAQVKKGLAAAFCKFDAFQLAKYNRDHAIKLRDVLFLCHAKPKDGNQIATFRQLVEGNLPTPDTWETQLSAGADKKATFDRLIDEGNLGYLALLRNLRNMQQAGCDMQAVSEAIRQRRNGANMVLPFRFIAAARACPQVEPALDESFQEAVRGLPALDGETAVLVDVSGSMDDQLSAKSDMRRIDAAAALGAIVQGRKRVFTFSTNMVEVPPRNGMAGVDAIVQSQPHSSTRLGEALTRLNGLMAYDRLIVITDEQTQDNVPQPTGRNNYLINVASNRNGVGYRNGWTHIDGFSENVFRYIAAHESADSR